MNRLWPSLLFGLRPSDPVTIATFVALISGVAWVACYLPPRARRAWIPMIVLARTSRRNVSI